MNQPDGRVLTRPSRHSGKPVTSEIPVTAIPTSPEALLAVPPVETTSYPSSSSCLGKLYNASLVRNTEQCSLFHHCIRSFLSTYIHWVPLYLSAGRASPLHLGQRSPIPPAPSPGAAGFRACRPARTSTAFCRMICPPSVTSLTKCTVAPVTLTPIVQSRFMDMQSIEPIPAEGRDQGRVHVDNPAGHTGAMTVLAQNGQEARQNDDVRPDAPAAAAKMRLVISPRLWHILFRARLPMPECRAGFARVQGIGPAGWSRSPARSLPLGSLPGFLGVDQRLQVGAAAGDQYRDIFSIYSISLFSLGEPLHRSQ